MCVRWFFVCSKGSDTWSNLGCPLQLPRRATSLPPESGRLRRFSTLLTVDLFFIGFWMWFWWMLPVCRCISQGGATKYTYVDPSDELSNNFTHDYQHGYTYCCFRHRAQCAYMCMYIYIYMYIYMYMYMYIRGRSTNPPPPPPPLCQISKWFSL
jgi:hypothetical protein